VEWSDGLLLTSPITFGLSLVIHVFLLFAITNSILKIAKHTEIMHIQGVSESSQTVIFATASVKEDERGSQGHTSASLFHQSAA
jgi:hypothetical protein